MSTTDAIAPSAFQEAQGLEDWRVLGDGACVFYRTDSFAASADLVRAIAEIPRIGDHPPAIDVRTSGVTIRLVTAAADHFGMTQRDLDIALGIANVAGALGLSADPTAVQNVLVIPGWTDAAAITPFWRAVLGYVPRPDSPDEDLVDPQDRGPGFWFEDMREPRPDGGGAIHIAVWVPHDRAEERVAAALAAGGHLVRDSHAPSWWTLADAAGNEADVATITSRD
jgi:4a-hydroxytetrahydrobiopterin dehydratase